jgi:hypothetical protein
MKRGPLYLVACVSVKRSRPLPAQDLYCSDWFLKARAYVEKRRARWFILSAKHGLVGPRQILRPYDRSLRDHSAAQRRAWAARVERKLKRIVSPKDRVVFLAGQIYREPLVEAVRSIGASIETPLRGMAIGQQKAWFKRRLDR